MASLITELKRRNVIKVSVFYLVASWLTIQVAETVLPLFDVPESLLRGMVILLAIGCIALSFAVLTGLRDPWLIGAAQQVLSAGIFGG